MSLARRPITIVEIDVDRCTRTYGSAPCTAVLGLTGARKCFNTFHTCQAHAAYQRASVTLRFCHNITGMPKLAGIWPALVSVSARPTEINLSGLDPRSTALGRRARVEITLQDFVDDDDFTDPYRAERVSGAAQADGIGYDTRRGTFFAKWLARSPYYSGRALRVRRGEVGQDINTMEVAHYVITEWAGPDAGGAVRITAMDPFDLVNGNRAVAPAPSHGKLSAAIDDLAGTATLTPAGIGADYPASGLACIGREIVRFTRAGDVLTLTARGAEGTEPAAHDELDVVQLCLAYKDQRAADIIHDLMTVQGPIDPAFIDLAAWQAEEDSWLGGTLFGTVIPKPTGIASLIGELCQHGINVWWDEVAGQFRFRINRPLRPDEQMPALSDALSFIEGTPAVERKDDLRVSTLQFWHGILDPTGGIESGANYAKLVIAADPSSASDIEYGEERIRTIHSRWFGRTGDDAFAAIIAERLVARYRDTVLEFSAALDAQDAALLPGAFVEVQSRQLTDPTGAPAPVPMQIKYLERQDGRLVFRAENHAISGRFGWWMTDPQADYDTATDAQRREGAFWIDESIGQFPDASGPYIYF